MSELRVLTPGLLTTVQDLGRWGFQSSGVSVAGPMDAYAHRLANALVGNAAGDAALEVTLVGPELECDDERVIAMTGAEFDLTVDRRSVPMYTPLVVRGGSRVRCGRRLRGARAYLAVAGGIDVPVVFGSRATHLSSGLGGFEGRALRAGDRVPLGLPRGLAVAGGDGGHVRAQDPIPDHQRVVLPNGQTRVRILPGPHQDFFAADALEALQRSPYRIDPRSDRMGFRLEGVPLERVTEAEMISDATPMGALQVPPSGQPILLMADRQTTGGYPTIATVITADLGLVGQLAPGESIAFKICSPAEAMAALIASERRILAARPELA
ncbi:MAG: biotin-dependent carboxyltransferase family protein [Acidobacteriota bacterium]